jgi:hypothetical protein
MLEDLQAYNSNRCISSSNFVAINFLLFDAISLYLQ